ncbi:MAG TPA: GNAT family protein [Actinomycetota bacterium]|nr:GNAT family protein [Actinomycetota bacterium]
MTDRPAAITILGSRLLLRPLLPPEIDDEWREMVEADPMSITVLPSEAAFRERLERSGRLEDGWLDLAIDLDGTCIGRIQTFVPPEGLPPGVFEVGIGLRPHMRGRGHGREALALLTDWLFERADASRVQAPTDPENVAMRTVFDRVGWELVETYRDFDRTWVLYAITRERWEARTGGRRPTSRGSGGGPPRRAP